MTESSAGGTGLFILLPLFRDNEAAQRVVRAVADVVRGNPDISCLVLDKTTGAQGRDWLGSEYQPGDDRIRIEPSARESNFFIDTTAVEAPPDAYVLTVHDDDEFSGLESIVGLLADGVSDVIVPQLVTVRDGRSQEEQIGAVLGAPDRATRVERFMADVRPQSFLFSAMSPSVWSRWRAYVAGRPMPSLSLDFTLALFVLLIAEPELDPSYRYRFSMHNWTDTKKAQESTAHWLRRDGWQLLGARDAWLIRLLDDVSLLGYLSEQFTARELRDVLTAIVVGQDGLTGGRARLGWASPWLPPSVRWPLVSKQNSSRADVLAWPSSDLPGGRWGYGRSTPRVDPRPAHFLRTAQRDVLPFLAGRAEGREREQIVYWQHWLAVLQHELERG